MHGRWLDGSSRGHHEQRARRSPQDFLGDRSEQDFLHTPTAVCAHHQEVHTATRGGVDDGVSGGAFFDVDVERNAGFLERFGKALEPADNRLARDVRSNHRARIARQHGWHQKDLRHVQHRQARLIPARQRRGVRQGTFRSG